MTELRHGAHKYQTHIQAARTITGLPRSKSYFVADVSFIKAESLYGNPTFVLDPWICDPDFGQFCLVSISECWEGGELVKSGMYLEVSTNSG